MSNVNDHRAPHGTEARAKTTEYVTYIVYIVAAAIVALFAVAEAATTEPVYVGAACAFCAAIVASFTESTPKSVTVDTTVACVWGGYAVEQNCC